MSLIRVSAVGLARIVVDDRYLVMLNEARAQEGVHVYSPVGGALRYKRAALSFLQELGAKFQAGKDLRLDILEERLDDFLEWFRKREGRELDISRELTEELQGEGGILDQGYVSGAHISHAGTYELRYHTDRPGQEGKLTQGIGEIFDVHFSRGAIDQIRERTLLTTNPFALVTAEDIRSKKHGETDIHVLCDYLMEQNV